MQAWLSISSYEVSRIGVVKPCRQPTLCSRTLHRTCFTTRHPVDPTHVSRSPGAVCSQGGTSRFRQSGVECFQDPPVWTSSPGVCCVIAWRRNMFWRLTVSGRDSTREPVLDRHALKPKRWRWNNYDFFAHDAYKVG